MKLLLENWRKYLKENEDPLDLGFETITVEDLTDPFRYINRPDEKKYIMFLSCRIGGFLP